MTGLFTTGTNGGRYRAVSGASYVLKTNEPADDVVARVEIPWDPERLSRVGVDPANTFVGKLSTNNQSWDIMHAKSEVNM